MGATLIQAENEGALTNSGTLALLDSYTHTDSEESFAIADGQSNTISSTSEHTLEHKAGNLILGKSALITGTLYVDNSDYPVTLSTSDTPATVIARYNGPLIYAASKEFSNKTVAKIEMKAATYTDSDVNVAVVFGSPRIQKAVNDNESYKNASAITSLEEITPEVFESSAGQSFNTYSYQLAIITITYPYVVIE